MIGALLSFCLMAVGARELSGHIDTFQILFFRSAIGLSILTLLIVSTRKIKHFRTQRLGLHSIRNIFHFGGQYGWFAGIGLLPLAEVFALEFTVPLWTALIAYCFLGERLTARKIMSLLLGLLGVFIIVQPGIAIVNPASLIVIGAAICYAIAHSSTKSLSSTESPLTVLFFMCLIQLPIGLYFSLPHWQNPTHGEWLWMMIIGVTALSANYCMTKAMLYAEVTAVVTIDFLRLPVIALVGVMFYSENFELTLIIGASLMLLGNVVNMYIPNYRRKLTTGT